MNMESFASQILFEDNHLLAVIKPAGLLVQGDATGRPTLLELARDYLKVKYHKPGRVFLGLVHRLDRQAAGVMVLARTSKAAGRLSAQFRDHLVKKEYWAVIHGVLSPPEGNSRMHLARQGRKSVPVGPNHPWARAAGLAYRTIETGRGASLVQIDLETGRRHQIRVQLAALGHPILGDVLYGSTTAPRQDSIGLLARSLIIRHPIKGEEITFEAAPPGDWPWLPLI